MVGIEHSHYSLWWIFPLVMMLFCFLMMLGRKRGMGCYFGPRRTDCRPGEDALCAKDILDQRYASGEIPEDEYQEMKRTILAPDDDRTG